MAFVIERAGQTDAEAVAPLFDAYRRFHGCVGDLGLARAFIRERLERSESTIFIARLESRVLGFTQLYPSFTSMGAARVFILNDLYVAPEAEGQGVGAALLETAAAFARSQGSVALRLSTTVENHRAQPLYDRMGWTRTDHYLTYELPLRL